MEIIKINFTEVPVFQETPSREWIMYGCDNLYPDYLIDLAYKSALHNAIVSSKVDAVKGKGLDYEGENDAKTDYYLNTPNPNETLNDLYFKCAYDLVLFGGFCLEIVKSKYNDNNVELYHTDFSKVRSGKEDEKSNVNNYWYSKSWKNTRTKMNSPYSVPAYNKLSTEKRQFLYTKEYRPGVEYYPLPSYIGATNYIEIDSEISNFHLAHIKNGMNPSMMINFCNGIPSPEERKEIARQVKDQKTGTRNTGEIIINFSDSKDTAPEISTLSPSQLDKQFIQLQATVLQNILSGHKVTSPLLVGLRVDTGFGNNADEIETSYELYNNHVIKPLKDQLLKVFNMIGSTFGAMELYVESVAPVSFTWSENILNEIMSTDEKREKIGLEPLTPQNIMPTTND